MSNISLKDFLIKYTAISEKFINEYYKFYELCEENDFGIESSLVANYLEYDNLKKFNEKLREKFILSQDYTIIRKKQKSQKDIQDTFYFLSFDGFEKACMLAKTQRGNEVRDYFITLRKFIDYYKGHISNKILELTKDKGYIYVILVNKNKKILKVGSSKTEMRKRLYNYSTGKDTHPDLKFIMIVDNPKQVEKCINIFLKKANYKNKKELYKIYVDKLKVIILVCAEINANLSEVIKNSDFNDKDHDAYIIYDDVEHIDTENNVIGYEREMKIKKFNEEPNNPPKKVSKRASKKVSKKVSKKASKLMSKRVSKKVSKKASKRVFIKGSKK